MRPVNLALAVLLALSACSKPAAPVAEVPSIPNDAVAAASQETAATTADDERLVRITRFDCAKSATSEDAAGPLPWAEGLRHWAGGGPGGAAWNADRLLCAAELQTPCTEGSIAVELRIGSRLVVERNLRVSQTGMQAISFNLPMESWAAQFDQAGAASKLLPYRTALFALTAVAACTQPETFGPGIGPRLEYADQDSFLAGFATGE